MRLGLADSLPGGKVPELFHHVYLELGFAEGAHRRTVQGERESGRTREGRRERVGEKKRGRKREPRRAERETEKAEREIERVIREGEGKGESRIRKIVCESKRLGGGEDEAGLSSSQISNFPVILSRTGKVNKDASVPDLIQTYTHVFFFFCVYVMKQRSNKRHAQNTGC